MQILDTDLFEQCQKRLITNLRKIFEGVFSSNKPFKETLGSFNGLKS